MIQGTFGNEDELFFEIELKSAQGLSLIVDALLDTGFSDWLVIDKQDIEGLDWSYAGERIMMMVKGEAIFDVYLGCVVLDGKELEIPVYAGDNVPEILLGRKWLRIRRLVVDIPANVLILELI